MHHFCRAQIVSEALQPSGLPGNLLPRVRAPTAACKLHKVLQTAGLQGKVAGAKGDTTEEKAKGIKEEKGITQPCKGCSLIKTSLCISVQSCQVNYAAYKTDCFCCSLNQFLREQTRTGQIIRACGTSDLFWCQET